MADAIENKGELIIVIVNTGYSDLVMQAARSAGARGGTLINARGTGNPEIQKFYGVPIQENKEMVFIIVKKEIKDKCLEEIYKTCGLESKGQGIAISIPVEDMIGFAPEEENKD